MGAAAPFTVATEWVHIAYQEASGFVETYGFAGNQGAVNLEGIRLLPQAGGKTVPSATLQIFMHPASTLQLLPLPRAAVAAGAHVLCAASRYAKNDTALIMEKVLLDLGAFIRHAKEQWGYTKIVLVGWSGGGALALFYQAQAERPTVTHTPAGDAVNLIDAKLIAADAVIYQAAHLSRGQLLVDWLDPSMTDEALPDTRTLELDLYDPRNPHQAPYSAAYLRDFRAAQMLRMRRITAWVKQNLNDLKRRNTAEVERGFITHRTMADPRFLDASIEPNGRKPRWCYLGNPETVNTGPVGLARFSTLRSWLSQWSLEDARGDGLACAAQVKAPLLVIENGADDAVPQPHCGMIYAASTSADKTMQVIDGASHYYAGQPQQLAQAVTLTRDWLATRGL